MNTKRLPLCLILAATGFAAWPAIAEEATTPPAVTEEDEDSATKPGPAVSEAAKGLKDVEGSRAEEAKGLKDIALANNPGFQSAVGKRNANANKDEDEDEDGAANGQANDDHPDANDHPGREDHPDAEDHPGRDDHPGLDDHPGGRPTGD